MSDLDSSTTKLPPLTAARTFAPGDRLAERYAIVRFVAAGGMGEVYEAIDEELGERVALKTVRSELAIDEEVRASFKREIQLARRVTHPNVCRIFDLGVDGTTMFLTMEYLDGETLSERLRRRGWLAPADALPILREIAAGLAAAHRAGILHGDLKPANVLLPPERVVVTDFGLASWGQARGPVLGSPAYLAPETLDAPATIAADVFAFGVLTYRMVTGVLPFAGDDVEAIRNRPPPKPPRRFRPDLHEHWQRAILRCLAPDPADRFAYPADFVAALERRPLLSRRTLVFAAAVIAATTLGLEQRATTPAPQQPHTVSLAARQAYTEGLTHRRRLEFAAAADAFTRATDADPTHVRAHAALAHARWYLGDPVAARMAARRALDAAQTQGEPERMIAEAEYWEAAGEARQSATVLERLWRAHPEDSEPAFTLLEALVVARDFAKAESFIDELRQRPSPIRDDARLDVSELRAIEESAPTSTVLRLATRVVNRARAEGSLAFLAEGQTGIAAAHWVAGELDAALADHRAARVVAAQLGDRNLVRGTRTMAALILIDAGRLGEAEAELGDRSDADARQRGELAMDAHARVMLALERGDLGAARTWLAIESADAAESEVRGIFRPIIELDAAHVALAAGDLGAADRHARAARKEFLDVPLDADVAHSDSGLGEVALAQGDFETARARFTAAHAYWVRRQGWLEIARTDLALARTALAADRPREAEAHARVAQFGFLRLSLPADQAVDVAASAQRRSSFSR